MKRGQNNKNKYHKKWLLAIFVLILLTVLGFLYYKSSNNSDNTNNQESQSTTDDNSEDLLGLDPNEQKASEETIKQSEVENVEPATPGAVENNQNNQSVAIQISALQQTDTTLQVRALIQDLDSTGRCKLELHKDTGEVYTQSSEIQPLANASTCKGFDIDKQNLGQGHWTVTITYSSQSRSGSTSQEVEI